MPAAPCYVLRPWRLWLLSLGWDRGALGIGKTWKVSCRYGELYFKTTLETWVFRIQKLCNRWDNICIYIYDGIYLLIHYIQYNTISKPHGCEMPEHLHQPFTNFFFQAPCRCKRKFSPWGSIWQLEFQTETNSCQWPWLRNRLIGGTYHI